MKTSFKIAACIFLIIGLIACGEEKASFATQEQARQQVLENAEFNAKVYRDANAPQAKIKMRGDSTISSTCITGDGWVTVDLLNATSMQPYQTLKCSSVSGTIGCMTQDDFQARKDYAAQDGTCNHELPFPLPKIVK
jgi:hypothetical protein